MAAHKPAGAGRSPLLFIFLTVFIDLLGFGIVIPLLPIYSESYGASEAVLGLLFTSFSGMQFLFAPMWGRLSDRFGRRPVLIGGLVGTALSYVLFANAHGLTMLFVSRLLAGFFGGNISAAQAYIADVTPPAKRAQGMGLIGAAFGLGFTFGPPVGGILSTYSMALPGYLAAGLSLAAATFGFFKLPEPPAHAKEASRLFTFSDLREGLAERRTGTILMLNFLGIFAWAAFEGMFARFGLALFPETFHLPHGVSRATTAELLQAAKVLGIYMFFIGIISAVIQGGLIRRLVPRFGETKLAVAGPLILGLGLAIIGLAPGGHWWVVILGCGVLPFGFGLTNPSLSGLISRAAPKEHQGAYMGMYQSSSSLARALGPYAAGWLFVLISPRAPFLVGTGLLALAGLIAWSYHRRYAASFPRDGSEGAVIIEG
jgi:multidrug resistance protein